MTLGDYRFRQLYFLTPLVSSPYTYCGALVVLLSLSSATPAWLGVSFLVVTYSGLGTLLPGGPCPSKHARPLMDAAFPVPEHLNVRFDAHSLLPASFAYLQFLSPSCRHFLHKQELCLSCGDIIIKFTLETERLSGLSN